MPDFIPDRDGDLRNWCDNFKVKFVTHGPTLDFTGPEVTAAGVRCDNVSNKISTKEQRKADYAESVEDTKRTKTTEIAELRKIANKAKNANGYTTAIGEDLQIISSPVEDIDFDNFQPEATAKAFNGYIEIRFKKPGKIDGVNIYRRAAGTTDWGNKIAFDTNSPYPDSSVTGGVAYDYQIIAVLDDAQVGLATVIGNVRTL